MGQGMAGLIYLKKAFNSKPGDVEINIALSKAYRLQGNVENAMKHIQLALQRNSRSHKAYISQGLLLASQKLYNEAIKSYQKALDLSPTDADGRFNLAEAYRLSKSYDNAIKEYDKVIRVNSRYGLAYQRMGEVYLLQNKRINAKAIFERLLQKLPAFYNKAKINSYLDKLR